MGESVSQSISVTSRTRYRITDDEVSAGGSPVVIERGKGTRPDRPGRQPLHRRRLLPVVQRPRPPPRGARRGDSRPARPHRPLDDAGSHPPGLRGLAAELVELAPPGLERVFYRTGSTAVEVALKMAFQFWHQAGDPRKTRSCPDRWLPRRRDQRSLGRQHGPLPRPLRPAAVESRRGTRSPSLLRCPLGLHARDTAAVMIDPIVQGAAGMFSRPDSCAGPRARASTTSC